jgi:hypothetical protein
MSEERKYRYAVEVTRVGTPGLIERTNTWKSINGALFSAWSAMGDLNTMVQVCELTPGGLEVLMRVDRGAPPVSPGGSMGPWEWSTSTREKTCEYCGEPRAVGPCSGHCDNDE